MIREFDDNRFLHQFPKVELVAGDACRTIPAYVETHRHLSVSLLFLDFDLYEPTKAALDHLLPRMPKGAVLAFDEINNANWPGETEALIRHLGTLNGMPIRKFDFDPNIAYAVL